MRFEASWDAPKPSARLYPRISRSEPRHAYSESMWVGARVRENVRHRRNASREAARMQHAGVGPLREPAVWIHKIAASGKQYRKLTEFNRPTQCIGAGFGWSEEKGKCGGFPNRVCKGAVRAPLLLC